MRGFLLAVAVLATIALSLATDEECVQRKLRGLPVHWPNPTDCSSFYRCTNKNVKRELLCPEGKEYNPKTGRCGSKDKNLCKLSLIAPLADTTNPCANEISGTFLPDPKSCRGFNICNNNVAYPQLCDAGSYFNTEISACEPDTKTVCWENFCVGKKNGLYVVNPSDCHSFYVCNKELPVLQQCPTGSYFNDVDLNCQPGKCPSEIESTTETPVTEAPTTTIAPETSSTTKAPESTTTTCAAETTTTKCAGDITTTTTTCAPEITTTTTTCAPETTTTTTTCAAETTTSTTTTTTCDPEITTTTTTCAPETTTTTTTCAAETTTSTTTTATTTTCAPEITTTTTCEAETTTIFQDTTTCAADDITTTLSTTTEENCSDLNCDSSKCLNAPDGSVFPALNTNNGFCVCQQQKPEYRECPADAIYSITLKICINENSPCSSSKCLDKPDYSTFPADNTTNGFCRCLDGVATYHDCAESDYVFDEKLGFCIKAEDCEGEVSTGSCPGGYSEGDFIPNPDNCMLFYICYEGELVESSCELGNYYDATIKACLPDSEGKCPACHQETSLASSISRKKRQVLTQNTCPEGAKTPAVDCDKYYKCVNGRKQLYGCGKDHIFNVTTLSCNYDTELACWLTTRCNEGDKTPHPHYCEKYFECINGKKVQKSCDLLDYFDTVTKTCVLDTEHICWDEEPCVCPGGYKQGDISPDPSDCTKFYLCLDGKQVSHYCGDGNYFEKSKLSCELNNKNQCKIEVEKPCVCPGGYNEGDFSAHPKDCDKYYICLEGQQILQECGKGNYFNNETLTCQPDIYHECWAKTEEDCTCPGGYREGEFSAHPTECNKYYICHDSHQVLQDCGLNNYFNKHTQTCQPDIYHICWPNLCDNMPDGSIVANPQQCNAFFYCKNNTALLQACPDGQMFSEKYGACVVDLNAVCYNPCANQTAEPIRLLPHPQCNKYYFCNAGKTYVGNCVAGSFDSATGICDEKKKCIPISCENTEGITFLADPYNPKTFYVCYNGKLMTVGMCSPGSTFTATGFCKKSQDPDCPLCKSMDSSAMLPTYTDSDNEYCVCYDGIATKMTCPAEYVFNPDIGTCYSNASCDPNYCLMKTDEDSDIYPNRHNSTSFCMCLLKKPIVINCPNGGSFNPYTLKCTEYEMSPECDQSKCIDAKDDTINDPIDLKKYNGFCRCVQKIATYMPCNYGSSYDTKLKTCRLNEINCNNYRCRGLADNSIIPAETTINGYCECVNGVATYYNCDKLGIFNATTMQCQRPLCDFSDCTSIVSYIPAWNTLDAYCVCLPNEARLETCENGKKVNLNKLIPCIEPCDATKCSATKPNIPSEINDYSFCTCHLKNNAFTATFEECKKYEIFDADTGACISDSKELCGSKICGPNDPVLYPAKNYPEENTNGFCVCSNGFEPKYEPCDPEDYIYDMEIGICVPSAKSLCNITLCESATFEHPITFPTEDGNQQQFCYCSSPTNAMVVMCQNYEVYNPKLGMCVLQNENSCPDDIEIDEKRADKKSCNKYYVCEDDVMVLKTCPKDQYFNVHKKDCIDDTKGICSRQSQCTCLGSYYENERLEHPLNKHFYYVCKDGVLHEEKCPRHHIYSPTQKQCIREKLPHGESAKPEEENVPKVFGVYGVRGKRSIDLGNEHEFGCVDKERRSVPSNCSQYEICINQTWQRKTCNNYRYYNPEQKKCLEPRDDFVCSFAKITFLPSCNFTSEHILYKAKNCQQYYLCQEGKWRLKSCGRQQYFDTKVSSCLPMTQDSKFHCENLANKTLEEFQSQPKALCQHLSQRFYGKNCAMYLICLDNDWWYQYCPPGMFYNRSLNYCVPDVQNECKEIINMPQKQQVTEEFTKEFCQQDGLLRPSALACNRYFVCVNGKWQMQHCSAQEFYDIANAKCSQDKEGVCNNLQQDCLPNEKRSVARNCSSYEQCSREGKWLKLSCPLGESYDELLQQCIPNSGICSVHGLKRTCRDEETFPVNINCTMFYYCSGDTWQLGNCLKGYMYSKEKQMCIAHKPGNTCEPLNVNNHNEEIELCKDQLDGASVAHPLDCTRYYICIQQTPSHEMQCNTGSYFEPSLGYCRPNDGSCQVPFSGPCANATEGDLVKHPLDCQLYYKCSSVNGSVLMQCPNGQYFNNSQQQCLNDRGECKAPQQKCLGLAHGTRLAHETYCNIFYACVKGLAIPVECPDNYLFNKILAKCVPDEEHICQNGQLVEGNITYSCGNLSDGSYIPDRQDCTRYYICSQGQAIPKRCGNSTYFDSELLLCVPDDGSCPYVDGEQKPEAPDPKICEGKHGYLMVDPFNCNNFYACIHNKLKHERCYEQQFFNTTSLQCQAKPSQELTPNLNNTLIITLSRMARSQSQQCLDETISNKQLCSELSEGISIAEPGDCRRYITCQEPDEEPISQRCRNGESFDSLLGFCRQNDGTCLLENGQRVGECSGKHGQLARDSNNCRSYFVCINGQKIAQTCKDDEYFSKSQNMCLKDTQNTCSPAQPPEETNKQSCAGLSESVLYPYIYDNCRSYFQCIKGVAKIHKCADDLYFDPLAIKCVKNKTECVMPTPTLQRSPALSQTFSKLCSNKKLEHPYPNLDNECRSFYICHANGDISHELCPLGMMFNKELNICTTTSDNKIICK